MKKQTIKIIGFVLPLFLLLVLLYFLVISPKFKIVQLTKAETVQELKNKKQCFDDGIKSYNLVIDSENYFQSGKKLRPFQPIFRYDKDANTCLYAGGFFYGENEPFSRNFIKDVYSNKDVVKTWILFGDTESSKQWDETLKKYGLYN